jgi:hypothetical protein
VTVWPLGSVVVESTPEFASSVAELGKDIVLEGVGGVAVVVNVCVAGSYA